jgi:uncharacterized glyoxalase superfamily protein PhnB
MRDKRGMVSHVTFTGPGRTLMFSDRSSASCRPEGPKRFAPAFGRRREKSAQLYDALLDGGGAKVPFPAQPWGGTLGVVHDRYGTEWIVTALRA